MAIPVSTISVRVIPLLSACSALHGLYEAGTHGAAPTFEHHESFIVSITDLKKPPMKNIFQEFKEIVSGAIAIVVDKIFRKDQ